MAEAKGDFKPYLEYLDKEMTIMGILSTFCVAVASLVLDRLFSADKASIFKALAEGHQSTLVAGSVFVMLAGLCFYLQRSRLAHFYGAICMNLAHPAHQEWDMEKWLLETYSWRTWLRYRTGFTFLMMAAVLYGHAVYRVIFPNQWALRWVAWILLALVIADAVRRFIILTSHPYRADPYKAFRPSSWWKDWQARPRP